MLGPQSALPVVSSSAWDGSGLWERCVVALAQAKRGATKLTPVERRHAILARPPPIFIQPQIF